MNALELADELERPNNYQQENNFTRQAATMLRTIPALQAEIAALKERCAFLEDMAVMMHTPAFPEGLNKTLRDLLDKAPLKDKP